MSNVMAPDLSQEVVRIFAEVTRYPADILDRDASLEDDLGIDSVKLGEIFAVLRERYHLPEKLDLPPERLKTIGGIVGALEEYMAVSPRLSPAPAPVPAPVTVAVAAAAANGNGNGHGHIALDRAALARSVHDVFVAVTRYPSDILEPRASLEEDLGIDSVKLGEIFAVLRERHELPATLDIAPEQLKTIDGITDALYTYLVARGVPPATAAAHLLVEEPRRAPEPVVDRIPASRPFTGKVAFVSGSGRGLGKDIAAHLASLGATVVVNSFHSRDRGDETVAEIARDGGDALHLWGSMAQPDQLHRMFDEIERRFGTLDFFISNASNGMLARIEDLTVEHWEKAFRTNVVGLHQGAVRAAALMKRNGGGKIITLSSPAAHGYVDYFGCMGAVKAAVECLTRALAIEFAPYNIQVNCVSPGPIDGELLRKWPDSDRLIPQWTQSTPIGRLVEHREVSEFIAYLLTQPVKAFTGSVLVMDGGISAQGW